ncbi:hypothetical protein [Acetobacterium wieringae]|uniref:Uncharacterized protein n=1 Tax=Acetobacterium wieringae TaxID=52694 RepID=A0A1F2PD03_9FIRM|nr:hypothetical protein [Acetobacterium wieringae]OFV69133.1 hypothetical protein ACWI_33270 [Acetobacterium wieringae]
MKTEINQDLYIELLQNELIYERAEHKNTISDLEIEAKYKEVIESDLARNINEKYQIQQEKSELEKRIEFLEGLIFELGDDLEDVQEDLQSDIEREALGHKALVKELKKEIYDYGMETTRIKKENAELKKVIVELRRGSEEVAS